jgi:hypothetical protein
MSSNESHKPQPVLMTPKSYLLATIFDLVSSLCDDSSGIHHLHHVRPQNWSLDPIRLTSHAGNAAFKRAARDYRHPAYGNECISNSSPAHILLVELLYLEACICLVYFAAFNQSLRSRPGPGSWCYRQHFFETVDVVILPSLHHPPEKNKPNQISYTVQSTFAW